MNRACSPYKFDSPVLAEFLLSETVVPALDTLYPTGEFWLLGKGTFATLAAGGASVATVGQQYLWLQDQVDLCQRLRPGKGNRIWHVLAPSIPPSFHPCTGLRGPAGIPAAASTTR